VGGEAGLVALSLKTNICILSVNFACNFVQELSEDAKKISQPVTFSHTGGDHLPHRLLCQPEASCGNLVSSRL